VSPAALILATLGFVISATLAGIKIWETFVARSRFLVNFRWYDDEASDVELSMTFTIANIGYQPDSIRELQVEAEDGELSLPPCNQFLPLLLQPGEISPRFTELVRTDTDWDPHNSLFGGRANLRVLNAVGRSTSFPIPGPYDAGIFGPDHPPPPLGAKVH
jgi:hypothetical protein